MICELLGLPDEERRDVPHAGQPPDSTSPPAGSARSGAIGGSREFLFDEIARQRRDPGAGPDRPDHPRARRRDLRLRPRPGSPTAPSPAGSRPAPRCSRSAPRCCCAPRSSGPPLAEDPTASTPIVEELLRYLAVVQVAFPRFAKQDIELGGQQIRQGRRRDLPTCRAANRDPRADAGRRPFDPTRDRPRRTSPSATASTAASAPSWPGWSCGWRTRPSPDASRDLALAVDAERARLPANARSSTASSRCRSISTAGCVRPADHLRRAGRG